jgi:lysophospholipase L1-like esterase
MMKSNDGDGSAASREEPPVSWRSGVIILVVVSLLLLVLGEIAARAYWRSSFGVPFFRPQLILYAYYPALKPVEWHAPRRASPYYNILLLGGSALHPDWGQVETELREQLAFKGHRNVRVFNVAYAAHTSRDSLLKYEALVDAEFDLVIFYHGINDARANNAPPQLFSADYSHYAWYETVNTARQYHRATHFALPYTLHLLALGAKATVYPDRYVSLHEPKPEWLQYGADVRSAKAFETNLRRIVDITRARRTRLMLMTFAVHVPKDYSREMFAAKTAGYGLHLTPIELWGRKENVMKAVFEHNQVIRAVAQSDRDILFLDQEKLMPPDLRLYNDPCHFSAAGSAKFVDHIAELLDPIIKADKP